MINRETRFQCLERNDEDAMVFSLNTMRRNFHTILNGSYFVEDRAPPMPGPVSISRVDAKAGLRQIAVQIRA